jgi:hypothetical protein
MNGEPLLGLLQTMLIRTPSLLVGGIGLYFALSRLGNHPRASKLAILGFSCLLLSVIGLLVVQAWLMFSPTVRTEPGRAGDVLAYWNLAAYPVNLVALTALGAAIFMDRKPTTHRTG